MSLKFAGIKVKGDQVVHKQGSGPVAGVTARVETAGEIDRRITVTRLALAGPFALAMRKKKDKRQVYLTVEGQGFGILEEVGPKDEKAARQFAVKLTALGSQVRPPAPPAADPPPPPTYGHLPPPPGAGSAF